MSDATERTTDDAVASLAARARARYAASTVDELPVLFFVLSSDGHLVHANATMTRLMTPDGGGSLIGVHARELLALEDPGEVDRRVADALRGGATTGEVRVLDGEGNERPLMLTVHRTEIDGAPVLVGTGTDLTWRITSERRVHAYEALVRAAFEASPDAIAVVGDDARIVVRNRRFDAVFPVDDPPDPDAFIGRVAAATEDPDATSTHLRSLLAGNDGDDRRRVELRDGRTFEHSAKPFEAEDGTTALVVHFRDVTDVVAVERHLASLNERLGSRLNEQWEELRAVTDRLEHLAFHDALTGLPNRRQLYDAITARLARLAGRPASASPPHGTGAADVPDGARGGAFDLVYIDLDRFKTINDRYGHDAGDTVLCAQAERLQTFIAPVGWAARLAGDEFVLILDRPWPDGRDDLISRLADVLRRPVRVGDAEIEPSASLGLVTASTETRTPDELLARADAQMYGVKRALGRRRSDPPDG